MGGGDDAGKTSWKHQNLLHGQESRQRRASVWELSRAPTLGAQREVRLINGDWRCEPEASARAVHLTPPPPPSMTAATNTHPPASPPLTTQLWAVVRKRRSLSGSTSMAVTGVSDGHAAETGDSLPSLASHLVYCQTLTDSFVPSSVWSIAKRSVTDHFCSLTSLVYCQTLSD